MSQDRAVNCEPLVSVVTVCLNAAPTIAATMESIRCQAYQDLEWVVIDGGSTDGTREFLERHRAMISHLASERDGGIFDAMNKGVRAARGQWLLFLNADDELADPAVLQDMSRHLRGASEAVAVVYGDVRYTDGTRTWSRRFDWITRNNLLFGDLCHQAVFARRSAFQALGEFDASLQLNGDYEWLLRVFASCFEVRYVPRAVATFFAGGRHSRDLRRLVAERRVVRRRFAPRAVLALGALRLRVGLRLRRWFGEST